MKKYFTLAPIFTDNMIFQANKTIKLFGKCKKNIEITLKFLEQEKKIKTTSDNFQIELKAENYRDKAFSVTLTSKKQVEKLDNVLLGDVYLYLGGQNIKQSSNSCKIYEDYNNTNLRFMDLSRSKKWRQSGKESLSDMSVLAYLTTEHLQEQIKHPIGVITYSRDDENIFSWSNKSNVLLSKEMKNYLNGSSQTKNYHLSRDYLFLHDNVLGFTLKSIIFYQGENDFPHFHFYEKLLRFLVKSYRVALKDAYLPFYIIQLSSFENKHRNYIASSEIRIAQANLLSDKDKVYVVSAIDIHETDLVSMNKNILSKRLAKAILEKQYSIGKNTLCPQIFSYTQKPCQVNITTHNNYLSLNSRSGQKLGFFYSENTVDFYPITNVTINNHQITMKLCEDVKEIRYAYDDNPTCDIYTSNGLPLLPFKIILKQAG